MKRALAAGTCLVWLVVAPVGTLAQTDADSDGLRLEGDTTYEVKADEGVVSVSIKFTATNLTPDKSDAYSIYRYYFDSIQVIIPDSVAHIRAVNGAGKSVSVSVGPGPGGLSLVKVGLGRRLWYRQTTEVTLRFDLVGGAPRSEMPFRINPAYVWFFAWAYGDPGLASVSIVVDRSMETELAGASMGQRTNGDQVVFRQGPIQRPTDWYVMFSARDDSKLAETRIDTELGGVIIRHWSEDDEWIGSVAETIEKGLPTLAELIGIEWPIEEVVVVQSYTPTVYGYGGWYMEKDSLIEIGEQLEPKITLHEVAHTWFNSKEFDTRWIAEGLVEEFAYRAMHAIGWEVDEPQAPSRFSRPFSLTDWSAPTRGEAGNYENFGYSASWWVINQITEEIGVDGLSSVVVASFDDLIAYRGAGEPEKVGAIDDWRRMLDLFEEIGRSETVGSLFEEWVVAARDRPLLRDRAKARLHYRQVESRAGEWSLPIAIRGPMGEWEFEIATGALTTAEQILDLRDEVAEIMDRVGSGQPSFENEFETAEELEPLVATMEANRSAALALDGAHQLIDSAESPLVRIGLWFSGAGGAFNDAAFAYESAEFNRTHERADAVVAAYQAAPGRGQWRLGGLLVLVALGGLGFWLIRMRSRPQPEPIDGAEFVLSEPSGSERSPLDDLFGDGVNPSADDGDPSRPTD